MYDIGGRLKEMGLAIPVAPTPVASYLPAIRTGNLVFTSGQLPVVQGQLMKKGKVGQELEVVEAKALARVCALNCLAAIATVVKLNEISRIIRIVGYVHAADGFTAHPAVVEGASELLIEIWGESGKHARSSVGVAGLPLDSPIEIELVVEICGINQVQV